MPAGRGARDVVARYVRFVRPPGSVPGARRPGLGVAAVGSLVRRGAAMLAADRPEPPGHETPRRPGGHRAPASLGRLRLMVQRGYCSPCSRPPRVSSAWSPADWGCSPRAPSALPAHDGGDHRATGGRTDGPASSVAGSAGLVPGRVEGPRPAAVARRWASPLRRYVPTPAAGRGAPRPATSDGPRWPGSGRSSRGTARWAAVRSRTTGAQLRAMIGPALDGRGVFAAIRARHRGPRPARGPAWEHAVGPMQHSCPETWATLGRRRRPRRARRPARPRRRRGRHRPLPVRRGRRPGTEVGWEKAVLAYNHSSETYVDERLRRGLDVRRARPASRQMTCSSYRRPPSSR